MREIKNKKRRVCYFCANNLSDIDYRQVSILKRFISSFMKIAARKRSGLCALHQRKAARAIKRAREMSLLPYIPE